MTGLATAAGCQLVATCDIAVITEQSRFATPGYDCSFSDEKGLGGPVVVKMSVFRGFPTRMVYLKHEI